ncbi:hypothetical protein C0995_014109 [Termitomyces sp. Mi166|nr:hypothetical protein C0995_014109 [Termitomyces sp. Mi166\
MAAFLQDSLAIVVVEGLLNQIKMMRRQCVTVLEHIKHAGKRKAPVFEKPMVEPKQARAPSQQPQKLVWVSAPTVARLLPPPMISASVALTSRSVCTDPVLSHPVQEPDIPAAVASLLAELSLEPHDKIMSNAPAVQQEQRVEAPRAPVASGSQAGMSSQGGARLVPELPEPHAQPVAVESHRLSASSSAPDAPGPSKHR